MPYQQKKNNSSGWFSKIISRKDALQVVKDTSMVFFCLAGLKMGILIINRFGSGGFNGGDSAPLFEIVMIIVPALFLHRFNSRIASIILLVQLMGNFDIYYWGLSFIILPLVCLWAGIRAVEATFKLHGRFSTEQSLF